MNRAELNNIGIIEHASIGFPGLTVITGKNSSGKSTVGKSLFALIDGGINIPLKYDYDMHRKMIQVLTDVYRHLFDLRHLIRLSRRSEEESLAIAAVFTPYPRLFELMMSGGKSATEATEDDVDELAEELGKIDINETISKINQIRAQYHQRSMHLSGTNENADRVADSARKVQELSKQLNEIPDYPGYTVTSINRTVQKEFGGQIQPVRWKAEKSSLQLYANETLICGINIHDNQVDGVSVNKLDQYFDRVLMIDDPMLIDDLDDTDPGYVYVRADYDQESGYQVLNHRRSLRKILSETDHTTVLERSEIVKRNAKIYEKLNAMLSGEFVSEEDGTYIVGKNGKLRILNLATGAKMVAILRVLIDEGLITKNTLLILDEPESHLHPEWQNQFAEIITLLVNTIGCKILMTTHSPNFFYALDTYAQKYQMTDQCAFYQAECGENGRATIKDVSNDVGKIYSDFLQYLIDMKDLRNDMGLI